MSQTTPHILMVDDEAAIRQLYSLYFKVQGFELSTTSNAMDTLNEVHSKKFDAVILDLNLRDSNGLDLIEPIHAAQPHCAIFIFTGQQVAEEMRQEAMSRGAFQFFTKLQPLDYMVSEIKRGIDLFHALAQTSAA